MAAADKYRMFHGKAPQRQSEVDFHVPKQLVYLGEAVAVEYKCRKVNGGGTGKTEVFRHEFESPVKLCMDERSGRQLYIIGNKLIVTEAGIEK